MAFMPFPSPISDGYWLATTRLGESEYCPECQRRFLGLGRAINTGLKQAAKHDVWRRRLKILMVRKLRIGSRFLPGEKRLYKS